MDGTECCQEPISQSVVQQCCLCSLRDALMSKSSASKGVLTRLFEATQFGRRPILGDPCSTQAGQQPCQLLLVR